MPKIIKDLEARLLQEAGKQIEENGCGAMTVRSVAKACGVGVGTVYNYFPSKEALLASYLLSDWRGRIQAIRQVSADSDAPKAVARCIFDQLLAYAHRHQGIFREEAAAAGFAGSFSRYHGVLRAQLAEPLRKFCGSDFSAEFIAESLLVWTMAGKPFDEIYSLLEKLF